jgi:hypothetical protein
VEGHRAVPLRGRGLLVRRGCRRGAAAPGGPGAPHRPVRAPHHLGAAIRRLPATRTLDELPARLKVRLLATGAVSQAGWWIAILVGYWNNLH